MTRRPAIRAVTATAGIALVAVGGFGLLAQPHASAATATSSDLCIPIPLIITCPSPTPPPSTSPPASSGTSTPASPSSPADTSSAPPSIGNPPTVYTQAGQTTQATQAAVSGPAPGPNLAVSHVVVRKAQGKLDVTGIVSNTGTVLLRNVPLSVSATGVPTQHYTVTLNPGQRLGFHTRWPFRATPSTKKVVVTLDPQHLVAETSTADNKVTRTKTFR